VQRRTLWCSDESAGAATSFDVATSSGAATSSLVRQRALLRDGKLSGAGPSGAADASSLVTMICCGDKLSGAAGDEPRAVTSHLMWQSARQCDNDLSGVAATF